VALAIVAGAASAPASAKGKDCSAAPRSSTPFAAFGDLTPYVLAQGGGTSLADGQSLTTDCLKVHKAKPVVRFFARSTSGGGSLHVELLVSGAVVDGGYVTATDTMGPTAQVVLPVELRSGNPQLQVRLTAVGGSFDVGDVYIDPYVQKSADL
jgi:hypothetical protein